MYRKKNQGPSNQSVCSSYFILPPQSHISSLFLIHFVTQFCVLPSEQHSALQNITGADCQKENHSWSNDSQAVSLEVSKVFKGFPDIMWTWCLKKWKIINIVTESARREFYDFSRTKSSVEWTIGRFAELKEKLSLPLCVPLWSYRGIVYVAGSYHLWV